MGKAERREQRRKDEPFMMTLASLQLSNEAYYTYRRNAEKDNHAARVIEVVMAAFSLVLAEMYGWRRKRLQRIIDAVNDNVWKVMQTEKDFSTKSLIESAKKFNIDLRQ